MSCVIKDWSLHSQIKTHLILSRIDTRIVKVSLADLCLRCSIKKAFVFQRSSCSMWNLLSLGLYKKHLFFWGVKHSTVRTESFHSGVKSKLPMCGGQKETMSPKIMQCWPNKFAFLPSLLSLSHPWTPRMPGICPFSGFQKPEERDFALGSSRGYLMLCAVFRSSWFCLELEVFCHTWDAELLFSLLPTFYHISDLVFPPVH